MGRRAAGVGAFIPFVGKPVVLLDAIHRGVSTCRFTLVILTVANFRAVVRYVQASNSTSPIELHV